MNLAEIRQNLRAYFFQTEKLRFENYSGIKPTKHREEIEEIFSDLFTKSTVDSLIDLAENSSEQTQIEQDARKILLQISQTGFLKNQTEEISAEIESCRKSVNITFQNEKLTSFELINKIKIEEKTEIRRELFERFLEAENSCADLIGERFLRLQENSAKLGFESFLEFFERNSKIETQELVEKSERFLELTEEFYFKLLSEICIETQNLRFADFLFVNEKLERKNLYVGNHITFFYAQILENFGFSVGKIPQIKLKKFKNNNRTSIFAPEIPEEIYLCLSVKNGAENYFEFLQNFGKAQKNAWTSKDLIWRFPEFIFAPDDCLGNAYGFLFRTLLADESFLRKSFLIKDEKMQSKIIKENKFKLLFEARREVLRFLTETKIYSNKSNDLETIWRNSAENFTDNLGFEFRPEQIIFEISTNNSAQKNVRSLLFAYGLREYFRERYDFEWWNKRGAFEEMIDFWNTAERYRAEEMASLVGFEMNFELLAESFR